MLRAGASTFARPPRPAPHPIVSCQGTFIPWHTKLTQLPRDRRAPRVHVVTPSQHEHRRISRSVPPAPIQAERGSEIQDMYERHALENQPFAFPNATRIRESRAPGVAQTAKSSETHHPRRTMIGWQGTSSYIFLRSARSASKSTAGAAAAAMVLDSRLGHLNARRQAAADRRSICNVQ